VIISSVSLNTALHLGEWIRSALEPLEWCHLYIPVLPKSMAIELIQCPTPFFIGIHRNCCDNNLLSDDIVIMDLDCDSIKVPDSLLPMLKVGKRMMRQLDFLLRPTHTEGEYAEIRFNKKESKLSVLELFHNFIREVLRGIEKCIISVVDDNEIVYLLDETMFLAMKQQYSHDNHSNNSSLLGKETSAFLKVFMRSQCLSAHITSDSFSEYHSKI
jgi:hypothetical protein